MIEICPGLFAMRLLKRGIEGVEADGWNSDLERLVLPGEK